MLTFDPDIHRYTFDGVVLPSVTQILQGVGLINFDGIDPQIVQQAASFGTAVHEMTALDDIGDLDEQSLDSNLLPYLEAWRTFRGAMKFDAIEQPMANRIFDFAGTPDRIGHLVKPTIFDIKTGTTVYPSTALQLAGYAILSGITSARRIVIQLLPTGKFKLTEYTDRKDREIFLAALSVYKWRESHATT
jgi:hypothetical protein